MTLATVAYRISSDVSFAAMMHKNAEEALHQAGIVLVLEEKTVLEKLLALPGKIARADQGSTLSLSRCVGRTDCHDHQ
jgi:hypothetical protein